MYNVYYLKLNVDSQKFHFSRLIQQINKLPLFLIGEILRYHCR